jgi:hypothetical protein
MGTRRMAGIPGFGIDRVATAVGEDPAVLRLENLDTDLRPAEAALIATRDAVDDDVANSWLPFTGKTDLKHAVADQVFERSGIRYDPDTQIVITCGEGDAMIDALFVATDPGDEVILTDPTYAGVINWVRIVGAVPRLVPLYPESGEWRLDRDTLAAMVTARTRAIFLINPGMPTGHVLDDKEWAAIATLCQEHDLWLIYLAWMERILFDGRPEGIEIGVGLDLGGVEEVFSSPNQPDLLTQVNDALEEALEDLDAEPLPDARQAGVVGQVLVEGVAEVPAVRQVEDRRRDELALGADPLEEHDQRQFEEDDRVDVGPAALGVETAPPLSNASKVEFGFQMSVEGIGWDQVLRRDGDWLIKAAGLGGAEHRHTPGC